MKVINKAYLSPPNAHRIFSKNMSTVPLHSTQCFLFTPDTLAQKLVQESDFSLTGYWHHRFKGQPQGKVPGDWYLGLTAGRALFSNNQPFSGECLLALLERYIPRLKSREAKQITQSLQQRFLATNGEHHLEVLPVLLSSLYELNLLKPEDVKQALRLKLLADLDQILFDYGGQASFLPQPDFSHQVPLVGFDLNGLIAEAHRRRLIWGKVKTLIPTLDSALTLNEAALGQANLNLQQEQHLRMLIAQGRTLNEIAIALAQDTLEIAKGLAQLVDNGLLAIQSAARSQEAEIIIIDDSPLMLQQFKTLVSSWGYRVRSLSDPTSALEVMIQANPIAIFLDINMPNLSGFDLLKQIRRQPDLATVPLVMLTAERTLSNNWRAQWSGCQFLTKPLSPDEIPQFKQALRMLLESIVA
jgi:CheY-like chemotaxis protein